MLRVMSRPQLRDLMLLFVIGSALTVAVFFLARNRKLRNHGNVGSIDDQKAVTGREVLDFRIVG